MLIAVSVASRSGLSARAIGELASAAEDRKLNAFFVAEAVADSLVLCQAALAATTSITVGTAVANARLRHPAATAMATATLDEWSGGIPHRPRCLQCDVQRTHPRHGARAAVVIHPGLRRHDAPGAGCGRP